MSIDFTPGQKLAIRLVWIEGNTQREAAKLLGVKEAAISTRLRRARETLDALTGRCGERIDADQIRRLLGAPRLARTES